MRVAAGGIVRQEVRSDGSVAAFPLPYLIDVMLQRLLVGRIVIQPVHLSAPALHQPDSGMVAQPQIPRCIQRLLTVDRKIRADTSSFAQ